MFFKKRLQKDFLQIFVLRVRSLSTKEVAIVRVLYLVCFCTLNKNVVFLYKVRIACNSSSKVFRRSVIKKSAVTYTVCILVKKPRILCDKVDSIRLLGCQFLKQNLLAINFLIKCVGNNRQLEFVQFM